MPIKTLGSLGKIRVGRVTGNTHIFFFCLSVNCFASLHAENVHICWNSMKMLSESIIAHSHNLLRSCVLKEKYWLFAGFQWIKYDTTLFLSF